MSPPVDLGFDAVSARGLVTFHGKGPDEVSGRPCFPERAGNGDGGGSISCAVVLVDPYGDCFVDGFSCPADAEQDDGAKDGEQKNEGRFSLFAVHRVCLLVLLNFDVKLPLRKVCTPTQARRRGGCRAESA